MGLLAGCARRVRCQPTTELYMRSAAQKELLPSDGTKGPPNTPVAGPLWSPPAWQAFRFLGISQEYPAGVRLFAQGDAVRAVGLVEEGLVKLTRWGSQTDEVTVGIRASGWPLGSVAALLEMP